MKKIPLKKAAKPEITLEDDDDESSSSRYTLRPKKESAKKEFLVSDQFGNFFCHYRDGLPYWSKQISLARELTEEAHFETLVRWEKGYRILKKEYLDF